jgi:hypothetical protein
VAISGHRSARFIGLWMCRARISSIPLSVMNTRRSMRMVSISRFWVSCRVFYTLSRRIFAARDGVVDRLVMLHDHSWRGGIRCPLIG